MTLRRSTDEWGNTSISTERCPLCGHHLAEQIGLCDHVPECPAREAYAEFGVLRNGGPDHEHVRQLVAEQNDLEADAKRPLAADGGVDKPPRFPLEEIAGETEVLVRCGVALETDHCQHEGTTVSLEEPAYLDDEHRIHLPGWTPECPECGQPHDFEIDGHRVMWR